MSKENILHQIKKSNKKTLIKTSLPKLNLKENIIYKEPLIQFINVCKLVSAKVIEINSINDIKKYLPYDDQTTIIISENKSLNKSNINLYLKEQNNFDYINLSKIDHCIVNGEIGVAENAAIWVKENQNFPTSALFLSINLHLILKKSNIVHNMLEAYRKIDIMQQRYGLFISGPSKTADIEQTLVYGAHGPMTLTIFLLK